MIRIIISTFTERDVRLGRAEYSGGPIVGLEVEDFHGSSQSPEDAGIIGLP
jgi:hypothetical protein